MTVQPKEKVEEVAEGKPWSGMDSMNPYNVWGKPIRCLIGQAGSMLLTPRLAALALAR